MIFVICYMLVLTRGKTHKSTQEDRIYFVASYISQILTQNLYVKQYNNPKFKAKSTYF